MYVVIGFITDSFLRLQSQARHAVGVFACGRQAWSDACLSGGFNFRLMHCHCTLPIVVSGHTLYTIFPTICSSDTHPIDE